MKSFKIIYTKIIALLAVTIALLMIPLIAMQFTEEVSWTFGDFIIAAVLLFGTGLSFLLLSQKSSTFNFKLASGLALVSTLFLIWSNLAVGIIGNENESINLLYFAVPVVGIVGFFLARFKAIGMSYTLISMAISIIVITLIAFTTGVVNSTGTSTIEALGINGFFLGLFLFAAFIFRNAEINQIRSETD